MGVDTVFSENPNLSRMEKRSFDFAQGQYDSWPTDWEIGWLYEEFAIKSVQIPSVPFSKSPSGTEIPTEQSLSSFK